MVISQVRFPDVNIAGKQRKLSFKWHPLTLNAVFFRFGESTSLWAKENQKIGVIYYLTGGDINA